MTPVAIELATLAATLIVEVVVALALSPRGSRRAMVVAIVSVNLISHPLASAILTTAPTDGNLRGWLLVEALVIAFEGGCLVLATGAPATRVWLIVVLSNVFSAGVGLVWALGPGRFGFG